MEIDARTLPWVGIAFSALLYVLLNGGKNLE